MSSINGQHDLMQVTNPTTLPGNIGLISALSEDSESDHEKTATSMNNQFDPSVQLALKKPPNTGGANLGKNFFDTEILIFSKVLYSVFELLRCKVEKI